MAISSLARSSRGGTSSLPSKKSAVKSSASSSANLVSQITAHESALSSSDFNPNPLIPLLALARNDSPEIAHKAAWALYRVYVKLIAAGRVRYHGARRKEKLRDEGAGDEDEAKKVSRWMNDRFDEYVETLQGMLRDSEPSLRKSAVSVLLSLLPPLSESLSALDPSQPPVLHIPYLRTLIQALLLSTISLRGSKPHKKSSERTGLGSVQYQNAISGSDVKLANQYVALEGDEDEEEIEEELSPLPKDVAKEVVDKLAAYDDLRWGFFHEISNFINSYTSSLSSQIPPSLASNVIALILPLNNLPKLTEDINEFFCSNMATKPSKVATTSADAVAAKKGKKSKLPGANGPVPSNGLDWMKEFESSSDEDDEEENGGVGGKKRKRALNKKVASGGMHVKIRSVDSHRRVFTECWMSLLELPLTKEETRAILLVLHSTIFPNMMKGKVIRITDWLGSLCDRGGPLALLSLNGIFVLIRDYNLEYAHFYRRLYTLMDSEVMHVKYRARFFRLSEVFLASSHLPASLIAAFIKKLARLSLTAPPAAIIMIIPFIYNLFKKHPSCMLMLQRDSTTADPNASYEEIDPYNAKEQDPMKSNALDSSLWELKTLQQHYLSHVATLAKIFGEVFTKPEFLMEDFLDHGYSSLFETEIKRRLKNPPALATGIEKPPSLLPLMASTTSQLGVTEDEDEELVGEPEENEEAQADLVSRLFAFA